MTRSLSSSKETTSRIVPVLVYKRDGSRCIVGEARVMTSASVDLIADIKLDGHHALDILQNGSRAFSIGFPSDDIDDENRQDAMRPLSWRERLRLLWS